MQMEETQVTLPTKPPKKRSTKGGSTPRCKLGHLHCKVTDGSCSVYKAGAPDKWNPEINRKLIKYFDVQEFSEERTVSTTKSGETTERIPKIMPQFFRFEMDNDLSIGLLSKWAQEEQDLIDEKQEPKRPGFLQAYQMAKDLQANFLVQVGMQGITPPASFIFIAKNITKMKDKVETEVSGPDGTPFQVSVVHFLDPKLHAQSNAATQLQPPALPEATI